MTPAKAMAATSPSEKPAAQSGETPASRAAAAQAQSMAKRQGWVLAVTLNASAGPEKHISSVPGRRDSARSKAARAAGDAS